MCPSCACRWHAEHQELHVRKRIALAEWRNQKEAKKAALATKASADPPSARQAQQHRQQHQEHARMSRQAAHFPTIKVDVHLASKQEHCREASISQAVTLFFAWMQLAVNDYLCQVASQTAPHQVARKLLLDHSCNASA